MSVLRTIREKKGFTLGQLAGRAGIPARVLAEYEEGQQVMGLAHAKLLAKALWVGIEELIPPPGAERPASTTPNDGMGDATAASGRQSSPDVIAEPHVPASAGTQYAGSTLRQSNPMAQATHPAPYRSMDQQRRPSGTHGASEQRSPRPPKVNVAPAMPITDGQLQELVHLASRLQIDEAQLEERVGKGLADLKRTEAKEWIKRLRGMADQVAPGTRIRYGQWPGAEEDREAVYLQEQKEAQARFIFKLFNGETVIGIISDFTPYTIIAKQDDEEVVLRKLAIAYYRRLSSDSGESVGARPARGKKKDVPAAPTHDHARDNHQPLDKGIDSDNAGTPDVPEKDNVDKDRGA